MATLRKTLFSVRGSSSAVSADRGKDINPQQVSSIPDDDFGGKGVDLNVKYYGRCVVTEPRGEKMAHAAIKDLKQQLQATSGHKQRVCVNLSMFGVQLFDEKRSKDIARHAVKAISFMTIDPEDNKIFSFIAAEGPNEQDPVRVFRLYCFKSEKQTPLITKSMMRIFKLAHAAKQRQQSASQDDNGSGAGDVKGAPIVRRATTKHSPLPPIPGKEQPSSGGGVNDESPYASLSSNVSSTPANPLVNRNSLQLMDFNATTTSNSTFPHDGSSTKPPQDNSMNNKDNKNGDVYASVNVGSKHTFTMEQFGLILGAVDDVNTLPAPIGKPFKDIAPNPFANTASTEENPSQGTTVRNSTLVTFDPVFGAPPPAGSDSNFANFSSNGDAERKESQVYAVPRFPPIRAVLGGDDIDGDDDTGRDSGALFPS